MLNENQKKAVEIIDKPLIVIAGPGTGKTNLICEKVYYLLEKNFDLNRILVLSFTNKSAEKINSKIYKKTKLDFVSKTFHSFALELIDEYIDEISQINKGYVLLSDLDQKFFFHENFENIELNSVVIKNNKGQIINEIQSSISKFKNFGYTLQNLEKLETSNILIKTDIFSAYVKYEVYKKKNNYLDFADILIYLKELLEKNISIRKEIQDKCTYILVDEFQDTNKVQLDILKLILTPSLNNITIVTDQKQSIYSFKGANNTNLVVFKNYFKNYEIIYLKENYRFSKKILNLVNEVCLQISDKNEILISKFNFDSENIGLISCMDENSQLTYILNKINSLAKEKKNNSQIEKYSIAVITREKSELKVISDFLSKQNIIHKSVGLINFLFNPLIKLLISNLKVISNPKEMNIDLFNILSNLDLKLVTLRKISRKSSMNSYSIFNVLNKEKNLSDDLQENIILGSFIEKLNLFMEYYKSKITLFDLSKRIIEKNNFYNISILNKNLDNIRALNSFLKFIQNYEKIYDKSNLLIFLKFLDLSKSNNLEEFDYDLSYIDRNDIRYEGKYKNKIINEDKVKTVNLLPGINLELLTIHQSKGREFDYVFLPYLNDRKFPLSYKKSKFELSLSQSKEEFLDEEKRLFFVAISRAKKNLDLLYLKKVTLNKFDSKPSIFLKSLNLKLKEYSKNVDLLSSKNINDEVRLLIISKIQDFLLNDYFEEAKKEIDLLKFLFSKPSLGSYVLEGKHLDLDFYKNKLEFNDEIILKVDPEKMIYSVSQLKTYESCPKKYMYQYIYKIPSEVKHFFDFGTSVHDVLENLISEFDKKLSRSELFSISIKLLHSKWISKGYENARQEKEYFKKGLEAIQLFLDKEFNLRKENRKTVGLEKKFIIEIAGKKLLGFIDRVDIIDGEYEILDYKTSNSMETVKQLRENLQLYVYAIALKQLPEYNKYPKKVGLWYLIHDKIVLIEITIDDLEKSKKKILSLIEKIEKSDFRPNPGQFNCTYCDFNKICDSSVLK